MRPAERAVLVSIVVVIAAALRVAFVSTADVQSPLRVDAGQYAQYAHNLVEHGVYSLATATPPAPDSFRSPGYPLFLALCRALGGEQGWYALARWLQVALSTLTVLVAYRLARQFVGFGPSCAAAALVALSPHLVVSPAFVLTECLSAFVVTTAIWLLVAAKTTRTSLLGAAVLGFAPLCTETLVFLPLVFAAALWRRDRRRAVAIFAVAMLPFLAWNARNATTELARSGSERATASISHGSYPGMVFEDPRYFGFPYREDPAQPEFGQSWSNLFEVLGPRVAAAPLSYARWYLLDKPVWLWSWPLVQGNDVNVYPVGNSPYERQPVMAATHAAMRWLHVPVMLLAAAGAIVGLLRGRRDPTAHWAPFALGAVALLGTLAYLPVIPDPRYLQPIRPLLFVLAGAALSVGFAWLRGARRRGVAADGAADPSAA
ncbi:MAG: glycosyltransferase family 39 protein [Planctomycetes bacterium]|nr:glycosyltransferase family 39 protein [Planctomycetota bacterium]